MRGLLLTLVFMGMTGCALLLYDTHEECMADQEEEGYAAYKACRGLPTAEQLSRQSNPWYWACLDAGYSEGDCRMRAIERRQDQWQRELDRRAVRPERNPFANPNQPKLRCTHTQWSTTCY